MRPFGRQPGMIGRPLGSPGGVSWSAVPEPAGWSWNLPFTIEQRGRVFRAKDFNLQARAGITVSKTYYVDSENGNDGNTGADWDNAFATLNAVESAGDADRVYVKGYFYKNQRPGSFSRDIEVIGADSPAITSDVTNQAGSWTNVSSYYWAAIGEYVAAAYDQSNLDSFGHPIRMTARASIAEVDANPNSVYVDWGNTKIYIRTYDDRAPDSDIVLYDSLAYSPSQDSRTYYFEGITFKAGVRFQNASAAGGIKVYLKDCTLGGLSMAGVDECILEGCQLYNFSGDGINYDARNGVDTQAIEIDCEITNGGTGTSDQTSTTHNSCDIVRINGKYHHVTGQCIADTGGGQSWLLGGELYNSLTTDVGFYSSVTAWLDSVTIHDVSTDLQNTAGTTIYTRDLVSGGNDSISGTLSAY